MDGRDRMLASVDRAIALLGRYCTGGPETGAEPGPDPARLPAPLLGLARLIEAIERLR